MSHPVLIPHDDLNPDTLVSLIEELVSRDGTDYGAMEKSMASKIDQVMQDLRRGMSVIVFDPDLESCSLMSREQWAATGNFSQNNNGQRG